MGVGQSLVPASDVPHFQENMAIKRMRDKLRRVEGSLCCADGVVQIVDFQLILVSKVLSSKPPMQSMDCRCM